MKRLAALTAAAALVVAFGFAGTAKAEIFFPFDGDLVGYWHFDTNAGTANAIDGSGNGNDGTLEGDATRSATVPPVANNTNSVDLDPTVDDDDFVEILDPGVASVLDVAGALTLSAWVKKDVDEKNMEIIAKWVGTGDERSYELFLERNNNLFFRITSTGLSADKMEIQTTNNLFSDTTSFHHVAGTFDPTGPTIKIYFDGVEITGGDVSVTGSETSIFDSDSPVNIGIRDSADSDNFFDGLIDEVRIYDVALSGAQIAVLASETELFKGITSGPNNDGDNRIDLVVPTLTFPDAALDPYDFTITYVPEGTNIDILIVDTVPAEWQVEEIETLGPNDTLCFDGLSDGDGGTFDAGPGNKKCNREKSATIIEWTPNPANDDIKTLNVVVDIRQSPSGKSKFKPTSCGPLFLNDGAEGFALPLAMPDPVSIAGPTDQLCLAAVDNPGTSTGDRGPSADHDSDTLASFAEACTNVPRSDPCLTDTDLDGVADNVDNCPLISNAAGQGDDADSDGVGTACDANDGDDTIGVAQCADGIDNDGDGRIDHSSSALSDKGGDTLCSSPTDNDESV